MKYLIVLLLASCSVTQPKEVWLDSIEITLGNGPIKVLLAKPETVRDISKIQGACVSKDLDVATLLHVDSQCPPDWFTAKGKVIK